MNLRIICWSNKKTVSTLGSSMIWISLLLLFIIFFSNASMAQSIASDKTENQQINFPEVKNFAGAKIIHKIIELQDSTFGYDIYAGDRLMIHQPSIPGMPGNSGFNTKEDAEKVVQLVIKKISIGEMPPSISTDELKALKIYK